MDKKENLEKRIIEYEKKIENNKFKRIIMCIGVIAILFLCLFFKTYNIEKVLIGIVVSILGAILYFYINLFVFIPLVSKAIEENKILEEMKKQYVEIQKADMINNKWIKKIEIFGAKQ